MTNRAASFAALLMSAWAMAATSSGPVRSSPPGHGQPAPTVTVPLYGAFVSDPMMSKADGDALEARIGAKMAAIQADVAQIREAVGIRPRAVAPPAPGKPDAAALLAAGNCGKCHAPGVAADSGGGLVLFADDDGRAPLRPMPLYVQTRVRQAVADGSMPRGRKLAPEVKAQFQQFEVR
jgi:hypothetical protein